MQTGTRPSYLNLPNALSILRLVSAPVLVVLLLSPGRALSLAAAVLFVLVCVTDWLDGYLARRMGIVTPLGKFLDPLADKAIILSALIMLIPLGRVPAWMVAMVAGREIAVTGLRAVASNMGVVIAAGTLGKYKTFFQMVSITGLLLHYRYMDIDFQSAGMAFFYAAFALTLWSGADYFVRFFRYHTLMD